MPQKLGQHAVVIGGSIAGLMTARVLSDHFDRVTIFERDQLEDGAAIHKSTPQGNHVHALLGGGEQIMTALFPGFGAELEELGAVPWKAGCDAVFYSPVGKSYNLTGSVREPRDLGLVGHVMSRGLLEYALRRRAIALPNVRLQMDTAVEELTHEKGRVTGVRIRSSEESESVTADLVVDAGGRGSRAARWLGAMGVPAPEETTIGVDFAYTSTKYKKPASAKGLEPIILVGGPPPKYTNGALLEEIENNEWHLSVAGRFGQYPPTDEKGFLEFVKALPSPIIYDLIKHAERIAEISHHRFPTSILRHYERIANFPDGLLILGDAVCSFNPVYGQGMTSSAMQAWALQTLLKDRAEQNHGLAQLASAFFPRAMEVISTPWTLAANSDFAYPQTTGERPPAMEEGFRYFAALDALQAEDPSVQRVVLEVFQLIKPLSAFWDDSIRDRVFAKMQQRASG